MVRVLDLKSIAHKLNSLSHTMLSHNNSGQVVYAHVHFFASVMLCSIIGCYQPNHVDAVWLGRLRWTWCKVMAAYHLTLGWLLWSA